jgi:hypothetical protein
MSITFIAQEAFAEAQHQGGLMKLQRMRTVNPTWPLSTAARLTPPHFF